MIRRAFMQSNWFKESLLKPRFIVLMALVFNLVLALAANIVPIGIQTCIAQQMVPAREYQIKASLIFNFIHFVDWPPQQEANTTAAQNLRVCIVGPDRFGAAIEKLKNEIVHGLVIEVHSIQSPNVEELKLCRVLFIAKSQDVNSALVLSDLADQSILTIGESPDFLDQGGIINLLVENNRVVFDINRLNANRARLGISSKLLRVARHTKEG